jgi:hypothetical protein
MPCPYNNPKSRPFAEFTLSNTEGLRVTHGSNPQLETVSF